MSLKGISFSNYSELKSQCGVLDYLWPLRKSWDLWQFLRDKKSTIISGESNPAPLSSPQLLPLFLPTCKASCSLTSFNHTSFKLKTPLEPNFCMRIFSHILGCLGSIKHVGSGPKFARIWNSSKNILLRRVEFGIWLKHHRFWSNSTDFEW